MTYRAGDVPIAEEMDVLDFGEGQMTCAAQCSRAARSSEEVGGK
jgi:hypothetical protein